MAYEIIDWVVNNIYKIEGSEYVGALSRRNTLSKALQNQKDKRIVNFAKNSDLFNATSDSTGESFNNIIDNNNEDWKQTLLTEINSVTDQSDLDIVEEKLSMAKSNQTVEDDSIISMTTELNNKRINIEKESTPVITSQTITTASILGIPEAEVTETGPRALQQATEGIFLGRILDADSLRELDSIENELDQLPTKASSKRIKTQLSIMREEIENE